MKSKTFLRLIGLLVLTSLNLAMTFPPAARPVSSTALDLSAATPIPTLEDFVALRKNGQATQVVGVYVPEVLALSVAQQPANKLAYVNASPDTVTQFSIAARYGSTGFLAHNYLSGALFFNLSAGQEVDVIYGDGTIRTYTISSLRHFQALSPMDTASNFVDLDNNSGAQIANADLFQQIYTGDQVVFQTCITANGNTSWGRLFVIATPTPAPNIPDHQAIQLTGKRASRTSVWKSI